jgi:glycine dehydrogenase subunit 2
MRAIAEEAATNPELVKTAPHTTRVRRLDEVGAARRPILRWDPNRQGSTLEAAKREPQHAQNTFSTPVVPSAD